METWLSIGEFKHPHLYLALPSFQIAKTDLDYLNEISVQNFR